jgi:hypothetical protein
MKNRRWLFCLVFIGLVLFILDSSAFSFNDTQKSRETLRGVTPVYVVIEGITPELEQSGLSAKQLKADAEIQLRKAGINVISKMEKRESPESYPAGLYVRINSLKSDMLKSGFDIDYYAINISVDLIQRCLPLTEKNIDSSYVYSHSALACTWSTSNIYLAGEERIGNIRDCVKELVVHFIDAYVSVNPKQ